MASCSATLAGPFAAKSNKGYDKSFTTFASESFSEVAVMVSTTCFPDIIGKRGAIIRVMEETLGVEVSMPNASKNAPGKHPIKIAGGKGKVKECKAQHHHVLPPRTHTPWAGLTHADMEVPHAGFLQCYARINGQGLSAAFYWFHHRCHCCCSCSHHCCRSSVAH